MPDPGGDNETVGSVATQALRRERRQLAAAHDIVRRRRRAIVSNPVAVLSPSGTRVTQAVLYRSDLAGITTAVPGGATGQIVPVLDETTNRITWYFVP